MESFRHTMTTTWLRFGFAALLWAALPGCATRQPIYYWGSYEDLLHAMYTHPGEADAGMQVVTLNEDIDKAHAAGKKVAPGVHAHLGYMHYQQGNVDAARREFETEKALFPESAKFIDGMLKRMNP